jgi:hypothetical protein
MAAGAAVVCIGLETLLIDAYAVAADLIRTASMSTAAAIIAVPAEVCFAPISVNPVAIRPGWIAPSDLANRAHANSPPMGYCAGIPAAAAVVWIS